jgi:hypothetical protein
LVRNKRINVLDAYRKEMKIMGTGVKKEPVILKSGRKVTVAKKNYSLCDRIKGFLNIG